MAQTAGAYVYHVTVDGIVRYVGKGTRRRSKLHARKARLLNERRARGEKVGKQTRWENYLAKALRDGRTVRDLVVVDGLIEDDAFYLECVHIASFRANTPGKVFNRWSGGQGFRSEDMKRLWADPAFREHLEHKLADPKRRESTSKRQRELWADPNYRETISRQVKAQMEAQWADPSFRTTHSARLREQSRKNLTEEFYQANGIKIRALWDDPVYRQKVLAARSTEKYRLAASAKTKALMTPERRSTHSQKMKQKWADPEWSARMRKHLSELNQRQREETAK